MKLASSSPTDAPGRILSDDEKVRVRQASIILSNKTRLGWFQRRLSKQKVT